MKQIEGKRRSGKMPLIIFLAAVLTGSIIIMENKDKPEETQAAAEPRNTVRVVEYHTAELTDYNVPTGDTAFKSYMDYRTITNTRSDQYKLQEDCWTDDDGLRRYDDKYVIAMGTYYTDEIGDEFKITLDTGKTFRAVIGDFKADRDTDSLNQYTPMQNRKCVIEFVVDTKEMSRTPKKMGDISYVGEFKGNVERIEKVENT